VLLNWIPHWNVSRNVTAPKLLLHMWQYCRSIRSDYNSVRFNHYRSLFFYINLFFFVVSCGVQLHSLFFKNIRVKQSHFRPGQARRVPGSWSYDGAGVVCSTQRPLYPPPPPKKYSRYSFLLEADSTPGPQCGRKDYVNEKFQWHHRTCDQPACSAVP
jgi:hypothetical protein